LCVSTLFLLQSYALIKKNFIGLSFLSVSCSSHIPRHFGHVKPIDGNYRLNFDPQIVQEADIKDVGPAVSGMYTSPTQQLGTAQAAFPAQVCVAFRYIGKKRC